MAKKLIANRVAEEYCKHWKERLITMNKQIAELVEEGHHDDIRIEMSDKKLYFILREYWMELTDI